MFHEYRWTKKSAGRNQLLQSYEPLQPFVLKELARRMQADMFLDVGANIGAYSVFMSALEEMDEIQAFEPAPAAFEELSANIRLNQLEGRVRAHQVAVSDRQGVAAFGVIGDLSGANGLLSTTIHGKKKLKRQVSVKTAPLDDLVTCADRRVCMKVDVEGHEAAMLAGTAGFMERNTVLIQIESYGRDTSVAEALEDLGLVPVATIGPDQYLTNRPATFGDACVAGAFQAAATELARATKAQRHSGDGGAGAIMVPIAPGLRVEASGPAVRLARRAIRKLGKLA